MGSFMRTQEKMDQPGFVRGPARLLWAPLTTAPPNDIGDVLKITGSDTNEVQTLTITGATAGTFTLSFNGVNTSALVFNAASTLVQAALEALSTIGSGGVTVAGSAGGPYTITFVNQLAGTNVSTISANGASLTGSTPTAVVAVTTSGSGAFDAVGAWTEMGGTKTGIQVGYNDTSEDFSIDQYTATIGSLPTNHEMWMQTALVEVTPERLAFAWDMGPITLNTTSAVPEKKMGFGTPSGRTQRRLAAVHRRPNGLLRLHFLRIVQRGSLESTLTYQPTGDQQSIPLRLNAVVDSLVADENQRFGYLLDQQAA